MKSVVLKDPTVLSSSDSDSLGFAATGGLRVEKRKRERKLDPTNGIRHIWSQVVAPRFGKLLTIVPSSLCDTALPRSYGNRLLSAGYERAVIECRSRVRKLVHESRMRGTKFLDREWNLGFDLETEDRNCLDGLAAACSLLDGEKAMPKGVKRPSEIFESPSFLRKVDFQQVEQGGFDNYWLMAAVASLANVENGIHRVCVDFDTDLGIYGFIFQQDGEWVSTVIDDQLYLDFSSWPNSGLSRDFSCDHGADSAHQNNKKGYWPGSHALLFSRCRDPNEIWLPLLEKAYAKLNGDYAALLAGHTGEALEDLTGGISTELVTGEILDIENFWNNELAKVNGYTYVILEANAGENGQRFILLSNPWVRNGSGINANPTSTQREQWAAGKRNNGGHPNKSSAFRVTYEELLSNFKYITRTRLFRDPDWHCSQVWSGIEVPWISIQLERFRVRLENDSPIIMVLSQLDTRSFRGLEGQYTFRLYFSLYAQRDTGEQEYIICSNESVKMNRSVSIELSSLAAGTYVIFVKVSGKRNLRMPTEEEVIEKGTKDRVENKKLELVGQAYNVAHLKAAKHMNLVRQARITASCKSASESRKRARRKLWERRHMNRHVTKLQRQKDVRKKNHLMAIRAAEHQRKAELNAARPHEMIRSVEADRSGVLAARLQLEHVDLPIERPPTFELDGLRDAEAETFFNMAELSTRTSMCTSDSPVEDWEQLYSSDDSARHPRMAAPQRASIRSLEEKSDKQVIKGAADKSQAVDFSDPWNAVCIVGFKVYSKDPDLKLSIIADFGEVAESDLNEQYLQNGHIFHSKHAEVPGEHAAEKLARSSVAPQRTVDPWLQMKTMLSKTHSRLDHGDDDPCISERRQGQDQPQIIVEQDIPSEAKLDQEISLDQRQSAEAKPIGVFHYDDLEDLDNSIRVLVILPHRFRTMDAIHCQLITTTFSNRPTYEALSYTWGRDESAQHIVINGCEFRVGQSLYDALYHLRHAEVDMTLWVDAICINQSHIAERNSQVGIMDIIYSRAQSVLVWLGFPECNHVISLRARQDYKPDLTEIQSISHHPYWERLWILQEIGLGREVKFVVHFISGVRIFAWEQFHEIWDNHLSPNMRAVLSLRDNRYTENLRLEVLLEKFRHAKCAEWRDKVFGLLGLATDNLTDALKVDYEISRLDLFANLVDFFYKAPALNDSTKGSQAWDRKIRLIRFSQLLLQILGYNATDSSDWPHVFSDPWRAFEVRACLVSTIMQVGPSCTDIVCSPKVEKKWRQGFGDHYPDFKELGLLRELYDTFHWSISEWEPWDQHKIRDICSKTSFGFLQNSRGYREMPRAGEVSAETATSPPPDSAERRVFLGSNHVLGFVPSHARVGDVICKFWGCDVAVVLRRCRSTAGDGHFDIVGRPRVCTRERGSVSFENMDSEHALGLWLDIDVLCSLTC